MTPRALRLALLAASVSLFAAHAAHAAAPCDDGGAADDGGACLPTSVDGTALCPVSSVGAACTGVAGGTCVAATVVDTSADGATTSTAVGACVVLPANACPTADVGMACGDGGICAAATGIGGGGGSVGSGGSSSISYGITTCEVIGDAGPSLDAGTLSFGDDASSSTGTGSSNGGDAGTVGFVGGPKPAPTSSGSGGGGGCAVASGASGAGGAWAVLGAIVVWYRRRKRSGGARS